MTHKAVFRNLNQSCEVALLPTSSPIINSVIRMGAVIIDLENLSSHGPNLAIAKDSRIRPIHNVAETQVARVILPFLISQKKPMGRSRITFRERVPSPTLIPTDHRSVCIANQY
jgi:hypothetical protein